MLLHLLRKHVHSMSVLAEQVKVAHRQLVAPSLDAKGRYLVGAAVGTRQEDRTRVDQLRSQAEVDVVILDSSQGILGLTLPSHALQLCHAWILLHPAAHDSLEYWFGWFFVE